MVKNISIADDVYWALKKRKKDTESFSDFLRRLMQTKPLISEVMGKHLLSQEDSEKAKEGIAGLQKVSLERFQDGSA